MTTVTSTNPHKTQTNKQIVMDWMNKNVQNTLGVISLDGLTEELPGLTREQIQNAANHLVKDGKLRREGQAVYGRPKAGSKNVISNAAKTATPVSAKPAAPAPAKKVPFYLDELLILSTEEFELLSEVASPDRSKKEWEADYIKDALMAKIKEDLEAKAAEIEGRLIAARNKEEIIKIISSRGFDDARRALEEKFDLTEKQATDILNMRFHQLTGIAVEASEKLYANITQKLSVWTTTVSEQTDNQEARWSSLKLQRARIEQERMANEKAKATKENDEDDMPLFHF